MFERVTGPAQHFYSLRVMEALRPKFERSPAWHAYVDAFSTYFATSPDRVWYAGVSRRIRFSKNGFVAADTHGAVFPRDVIPPGGYLV